MHLITYTLDVNCGRLKTMLKIVILRLFKYKTKYILMSIKVSPSKGQIIKNICRFVGRIIGKRIGIFDRAMEKVDANLN